MALEGKDGQEVAFEVDIEYGKMAKLTESDEEEIKKLGFILRQSKNGETFANKKFLYYKIQRRWNHGNWILQEIERVYYDLSQIDQMPK